MIKTNSNKISFEKDHQKLKVAIIKSNYYQNLTDSLEKACRENLVQAGVKAENIITFNAPGSWEIPLLAKKALSKKFGGIVALGVIIKGDTYHFEMIANECARSLMSLSLEFETPIIFEILASYNLEQAKKRSLGKSNKGAEAAQALLKILKELSKI